MSLACSFFHLNNLGWLAGLDALVPLSVCTAAGICVGCVSGCGIVGFKGHVRLARIARLAAERLGCIPLLPAGLLPCLLSSKGKSASGFIFSFSPRILCFPGQGREGGTRDPLRALRAACFPPCSQRQPFPPRGWTRGPDVSGEPVGVGCRPALV